ncbi:hypothetical protein O181_048162 [Austropuccinia psidii MF-1]|uniref:Uncharacterized protein n=1 Tax=Austropuccinia psidii MF-1 TaxID=1389203 RepID=A0A9Q3DUK5_9BASI|nr:hypothetical protein [Austropuccinia psidii MF-1]
MKGVGQKPMVMALGGLEAPRRQKDPLGPKSKMKAWGVKLVVVTLKCFERVLRTIKTSNNDNSFGIKINEQSAIIKELTDKYSKFNIDDIIETRIKQAINTIKEDNKKALDDISKSFAEVKTNTVALKKHFDTSREEISKLTIKLNEVISDNTKQTELWNELTYKEDDHKKNVIDSIQSLQHELRNSQRCNNSKMNDIEQLLNTFPRMSTPLKQNEGARIPNPQVLGVENSQLKYKFSTSFHNLEPSMGQELLKEVPKLKEWPHFSGEGEYDHMEFIKGIDMIKEDFELPDRLVTARFNTLFTKSAHRWYIKLRQAHGHQSWTWWKLQIINKWVNDAWRFKDETAFESAKFNAENDKALPWFCQQKERLTALYPDMSEFMIHREILRQCGGDLAHDFKSRTTEKVSAEDIINILEEVTTRTRIGSSRVNLKTRFNTPWKDSVDKNPKENSNNLKFKSADTIRKCHICQSTTHLANTCPKKGKINEIDVENEPDVEKDDIIEENPDDKSSIFSQSSKDIENINATFDFMESYSHFPELSNDQLDLSKVQDAQLMKTKPNGGKGYTAASKIAFLPFRRQITVNKVSPVNLEVEKFKSEHSNEAEISLHLSDKQENELYFLLYDHKEAFASDKEPLEAIIGHEADIILNIERPYPPLLERPAYPESPKSREALEIHIK